MLGKYSVENDRIRFVPAFPFDPGRQYDVVFDSAAVPGTGGGNHTRVTTAVGLPADRREPSTTVTRIYPTAQVIPENQLRLYVHFSAPMGLRGGVDQVALVDETAARSSIRSSRWTPSSGTAIARATRCFSIPAA